MDKPTEYSNLLKVLLLVQRGDYNMDKEEHLRCKGKGKPLSGSCILESIKAPLTDIVFGAIHYRMY